MVVDPRLGGAYDITQLNRLAFAASLCIRASSIWRPTMSEVTKQYFTILFLLKILYSTVIESMTQNFLGSIYHNCITRTLNVQKSTEDFIFVLLK